MRLPWRWQVPAMRFPRLLPRPAASLRQVLRGAGRGAGRGIGLRDRWPVLAAATAAAVTTGALLLAWAGGPPAWSQGLRGTARAAAERVFGLLGLPGPPDLSGLLRWGPLRRLAPGPALVEARFGFAWPEYREEIAILDPAQLRQLDEALKAMAGSRREEARAGRQPAPHPGEGPGAAPGAGPGTGAEAGAGSQRQTQDPDLAYWRLSLRWENGESRTVPVDRELRLFDLRSGRFVQAPETIRPLLEGLSRDLSRSFFGEPVPWAQVHDLFPYGSRAVIRDLETGRTLRIYRHGGTNHADIEPLTGADTEVLRSLFGGDWSWRRRAVVVSLGDRQVAASINGFPHGHGDIADNQFPGHFCLHFAGSRLHLTGREDLGHQLMVLKASGRLAETLDAASPEELVRWVLAAIHHGDGVTVRYAAGELEPASLWKRLEQEVRYIQAHSVKAAQAERTGGDDAPGEPNKAQVLVDVTVYLGGPGPEVSYRKQFAIDLLRRPGGAGGWQVVFPTLRPLLERPADARPTSAPRPAAGEC